MLRAGIEDEHVTTHRKGYLLVVQDVPKTKCWVLGECHIPCT